jgi:hypothetical protein
MMPKADEERRRAFEGPLRALIGERIARVRYFEVDYFDGQAHWFDDPVSIRWTSVCAWISSRAAASA